tara:strand:+ start:1272 stop:1484 length:213 start_codon:yes stop_codon:yes gene_type:complete
MKKIFCLITLFISLISYLYADNIKCDTPLQKLKPKCNIIGKSVDKMKEFGKKNKTLDQSYKNIKEKLKKK